MPELPEVQTTVNGLNRFVRGLVIKDVWTDYYSEFHIGKPNIKDKKFFKKFKTTVIGKKILNASRRGKNVLIHLSGGQTILVHMKMTGHLLYGTYNKLKIKSEKRKIEEGWVAVEKGPIRDDPYNRFVRVVFTLSDGKHLALSDLRKFAKVTLLPTEKIETDSDLKNLGPEPLAKNFSLKIFCERVLCQPNGKVKQVLMDQTIIAGIGNIYSDEMLWRASIHPLSTVKKIPDKNFGLMFVAMRKILIHSLKIGGDSESDYRDITGRPGNFQNYTKAYAREGEKCSRKNCHGLIKRIKLSGRSAHFCDKHQHIFRESE